MKTIVIPTDFSPNAENAIKYAFEMNRVLKAEIQLFHSYVLPVYATDIPVTTPDMAGLRHESQKALQKEKAKMERIFPDIHSRVHLSTSAGFPEEEIPAFAEKKKAGLVVMGTKGATGLKEVIFGTNTANVIGKLKCPLLAIPEQAEFRGLNKIVFATNYAENDTENISVVIDFARHFDAEVVLLHIASSDSSLPFEYNSIETLGQRMRESNHYEKISYKLLENTDIEEGINLYVDEIKADIVALTNRPRSLFRKLFDRSLSKKMAFHSRIPLLVFHVDEKGNFLQ
jgi:nucleotide-binding universal stress UspA family protein